MQQDGIPSWWLISVGAVVAGYHGLSMLTTNPTVQSFATNLGIGKAAKWLAAYPPWQSPGTKRFGRLLAIFVGLAFIVLGIARYL